MPEDTKERQNVWNPTNPVQSRLAEATREFRTRWAGPSAAEPAFDPITRASSKRSVTSRLSRERAGSDTEIACLRRRLRTFKDDKTGRLADPDSKDKLTVKVDAKKQNVDVVAGSSHAEVTLPVAG